MSEPAEQGTVAVPLSQLKALFFVRDLVGNPRYQDAQVIGRADPRATGAKRLQLTFRDGEQLVAIVPTYETTRSETSSSCRPIRTATTCASS
jgi:hypothetical protein